MFLPTLFQSSQSFAFTGLVHFLFLVLNEFEATPSTGLSIWPVRRSRPRCLVPYLNPRQ